MILTADELRRVHRTVRTRRFAREATAIGFGVKVKNGLVVADQSTPVVRFYFRKKKKLRSLAAADRVPPEFSVRLLRDKHFVVVRFRTDVDQTGTAEPSSSWVGYPPMASIGVVVRWDTTKWGLMTVGHAYSEDDVVAVTSSFGQRTAKAGKPARLPIDAIVLHIRRREIGFLAGRVLRSDRRERRLVGVTAIQEACSVARTGGTTFGGASNPQIQFIAWLPSIWVDKLGSVSDVVHAQGVFHAFEPGSSGAVWELGGRPAAVQVAARSPEYSEGFAQSIVTQRAWGVGTFGEGFGVVHTLA